MRIWRQVRHEKIEWKVVCEVLDLEPGVIVAEQVHEVTHLAIASVSIFLVVCVPVKRWINVRRRVELDVELVFLFFSARSGACKLCAPIPQARGWIQL